MQVGAGRGHGGGFGTGAAALRAGVRFFPAVVRERRGRGGFDAENFCQGVGGAGVVRGAIQFLDVDSRHRPERVRGLAAQGEPAGTANGRMVGGLRGGGAGSVRGRSGAGRRGQIARAGGTTGRREKGSGAFTLLPGIVVERDGGSFGRGHEHGEIPVAGGIGFFKGAE